MVTSLAEINTVYTLYKAKANQTPLPNTAIQRCLSKKKKETKYRAKEKQNTEQKRNPKPRANQTHGGAATARRRSSLRDLRRSSSSRRPSLARRRRSSLAHRRLPVVVDQNGLTVSTAPVLSQSASRYFSPFFSLTLSLSLSLK